MTDAIRDAYSALRKAAPLGAQDCGKLCGACCCKGSGNDGMELFHGEEVRYAADPGFTVRKADGRTLLICTGHCRPGHWPAGCIRCSQCRSTRRTAHKSGLFMMCAARRPARWCASRFRQIRVLSARCARPGFICCVIRKMNVYSKKRRFFLKNSFLLRKK